MRIHWLALAVLLALPVHASSVPRLFPPGAEVWLPAGTSQRVKVLLPRPPTPEATGYALRLTVPSWLRFVAADGMEGCAPQSVRPVDTAQIGGRAYTVYRVAYGTFPSGALDVTIRWLYADGTTLSYQPCLRAGGHYPWRHWSAVVQAPPRAAQLQVLIRKPGGVGVTGRFQVDNVAVRRVGSPANLIPEGDFEGPQWQDSRITGGGGMAGSKGLVVECPPGRAAVQDALWVPQQALPATPGAFYRIEMDARAERLQQPDERPLASLLFATPATRPPGDDTLWTAWETDGGQATGGAEPTPVHVLPPLLDVRPRALRLIPCLVTDCCADPAVNRALADNTWRAGMTTMWGTADNQVAALLRRDHRVPIELTLHTCGAWQWPPTLPPDRGPVSPRAVGAAVEYPDRPSTVYMCPTWALSEPSDRGPSSPQAVALAALEAWVAANVRRANYSGVDWDFEYPLVSPPTICFCPRCIGAFRREAGLAATVALTPELLVGQFRAQWTDFRLRQNAQLVGCVREAVRAAKPALPFSVYSGVQSNYARERCGVDWALLAPFLDVAMAGGTRDELQATRAALGRVPLIGYECYYASHLTEAGPAPDPRTWRNRLLRQCLDSGGQGVLIWSLPALDGGAFHATSEAAAVLARHEEIIRRGQRCDDAVTVTGLPATHWAALALGAARLALLCNDTAAPCAVTVATPRPWRQLAATDPVSGRPVPCAQQRCLIPPYGVRVLQAHAD